MATITGQELNKAQYTGSTGCAAAYSGYHALAAAAANATDTLDLCTIPAGVKPQTFNVAWTAHGGSGTLSFGWRYKDGSTGGTATAFLAATSTVSAGSAQATLIPANVTALGSSGNSSGVFDKDVILYATSAATAMPSGMKVNAVLNGEYVGTL